MSSDKLAFDPAGNLYVGHDNDLAPRFVRKIDASTKTPSQLGITPLWDPDAAGGGRRPKPEGQSCVL